METVISNSIFDGNIASGFGSAILASSGFEYKNCNFTNNYAPGGVSVVYYRHDSTSDSDENYYDSSIINCR